MPKPQVTIPGRSHSDDYRVEAKFDALPFFESLDDQDEDWLVRLVEESGGGDWGGSDEGDEIAKYCAERLAASGENEDLVRLFAYLEMRPTMPGSDDPVGFECYVDEQAAAGWLKENRPNLYAALRDRNLLEEE